MEDIQTAYQDCWVRDCGGREAGGWELAEGGGRASPAERAEGACPGDRRGAGLHSSEVPMGDWAQSFLLELPFTLP